MSLKSTHNKAESNSSNLTLYIILTQYKHGEELFQDTVNTVQIDENLSNDVSKY